MSNLESLSVPPPDPQARVVLFTRPGCHLCDAARAVVERVTAEFGERYAERDITLDPQDLSTYVDSIPVVVVDGVQVDFWRVSEDRLRAVENRIGDTRTPIPRNDRSPKGFGNARFSHWPLADWSP